VRASDDETPLRLNCESGFGSATQVTGTFGFAAAARVLARLAVAVSSAPAEKTDREMPVSSVG
jgi:tRNA A37 threonylcarbamoyladenosine dehydratase